MRQRTLDLLSTEVITVMHVLVFTKVRRDLTNFGVELYINVLLLAKQNCILHAHTHTHEHTHTRVTAESRSSVAQWVKPLIRPQCLLA